MTIKKSTSGKAVSIPAGLGISFAVNALITSMSTVFLSSMIECKKIAWEDTGYWIMFMLLISSFAGAKAAILSIKTQRYLTAAMSGIVYWGALLCITGLFFGGNFHSVFETAALIMAGSITAALIGIPGKRSASQKRRRGYR